MATLTATGPGDFWHPLVLATDLGMDAANPHDDWLCHCALLNAANGHWHGIWCMRLHFHHAHEPGVSAARLKA